jgi:NAD(P)-dependent dehydrogenase (short-subunit alcohol dehydrogenase family)
MLKNNQEVCYINCQLESGSELEPIVPLDKFGEVAFQFDAKNSWNKSLSELSVEEILNANLINQISPTLIIRELVQELSAEFDPSKNTIIVVNVTSNEGYFRSKDDAHIHTNMAKASLDMLSYSLHGSTSPLNRRYYYSVDPGFVSSVVTEHVPLTPQMGASRIFHPIHECFQ